MDEKWQNIIIDAKKIIDQVVQAEGITVWDIFYGGTRRIEYGLLYEDTIIGISLVDDLSYDFTVFTEDMEEIIYNNTQVLSSLDDLSQVLHDDITKRKYS